MFGWVILYIAGLAAFFGAAGWLIPHLFFKNRYSGGDSNDRGVGKYFIPNVGYALVYRTERKYRKYIDKYVLYENSGKKFLSYKLKEGIRFIDFDITLFNKSRTPFLVLNSRSIVDGEPADLELPLETAYISLTVSRVNNESLAETEKRKLSVSKFVYTCYFISMLALSIGFALLTKLCFGNIMSGVFSEDFVRNTEETATVIIYALVITTVMTAATIYALSKKQR